MAGPTTDPLGIVKERQMLILRLDALSSAIANYVGDHAGARDLRTKACEIAFRLNSLSSTDNNNAGTAFAGFGLENVSTA